MSTFDKAYKLTYPQSSANPKQNPKQYFFKELTEAHHNQITEDQWWRENHLRSQKKKTHYIQKHRLKSQSRVSELEGRSVEMMQFQQKREKGFYLFILRKRILKQMFFSFSTLKMYSASSGTHVMKAMANPEFCLRNEV